QDEQSAVTPGAEAVGCEPIEADVPESLVPTQHHIAEVLEVRSVRVVDIGDLGGYDFSRSGAGVVQELVNLVGSDVAEDAGKLLVVPEPVGARRSAAGVPSGDPLLYLVGCNVDGLDDLADRSLLDQFAGVHSGGNFEALRVHDGVDPAGLGDGSPNQRQIFHR